MKLTSGEYIVNNTAYNLCFPIFLVIVVQLIFIVNLYYKILMYFNINNCFNKLFIKALMLWVKFVPF